MTAIANLIDHGILVKVDAEIDAETFFPADGWKIVVGSNDLYYVVKNGDIFEVTILDDKMFGEPQTFEAQADEEIDIDLYHLVDYEF